MSSRSRLRGSRKRMKGMNVAMREQPAPLEALALGIVAGLAGTALMTGYQELVGRLRGGADEKAPRRWGDAPAPAQVGKKIADAVEKKVTLADAPKLTNTVHWAYGTSWGAAYGLAEGTFSSRPLSHGLGFGSFVWGFSYATMVPLGIFEPPWKYPPKELAIDLSYHLVYGLGVAGAYRLLERV